MEQVYDISKVDFESIPIDPFWNTGEERELKMHRIHAYPAKFPAFLTTKAIEFAAENKIQVNYIADVFCGCGTVALEAKRNSIDFWGCDINPVATLIASTKSKKYQSNRLKKYFDLIINEYEGEKRLEKYDDANGRLKYWFDKTQYEDLARLKSAIIKSIPGKSKYLLFFQCAFSNILKSTSRWLTKSIKPQIDPSKKTSNVLGAFTEQFRFMFKANEEIQMNNKTKNEIINANFLDNSLDKPIVDMIITSPPYVTSYEYADLHQLSSIWLGFIEDYRDLRVGSIGSLYHVYNFERELKKINSIGSGVIFRLFNVDKSMARSVAKYYLDMQKVTEKCFSMLSDGGIAVFIIGDTEYSGVRIENAKHLAQSLGNSGFNEVLVTKRKISKKILTPYRDHMGKFTMNSNSRKVYGEEYILIGKK